MNRLAFCLISAGLLLWMAIGPASASAVKNIVIDWESGEVTVSEDPVDEEAAEEEARQYAEGDGSEGRLERLRRIAELQQKVIRRQRALIEELRQENRRLERLLLGYDRLLRRSR